MATSTTTSSSIGNSGSGSPSPTVAPTTGTNGFITSYSTEGFATFTTIFDPVRNTTVGVFHGSTSIDPNSTPIPSSTQPPPTRPTDFRGGQGTPSQLYLLTFAITLSLLLSISLIILLRNLILRARERRIREAVAAGVLPPESLALIYRAQLGLTGLTRWGNNRSATAAAGLGPRPVLWDSWLAADSAEKGFNPAKHSGGGGAVWEDLAPLSITPIANTPPPTAAGAAPAGQGAARPRRTFVEVLFQLPPMPEIPPIPPNTAGTAAAAAANSSSSPDPDEAERQRQEQLIARLFPDAPSTSAGGGPNTIDTTSMPGQGDAARPAGVRVAVYVAMPRDPRSATPQRAPGEEEDGLEGVDVVLGTSDVRWESPSRSATPQPPR